MVWIFVSSIWSWSETSAWCLWLDGLLVWTPTTWPAAHWQLFGSYLCLYFLFVISRSLLRHTLPFIFFIFHPWNTVALPWWSFVTALSHPFIAIPLTQSAECDVSLWPIQQRGNRLLHYVSGRKQLTLSHHRPAIQACAAQWMCVCVCTWSYWGTADNFLGKCFYEKESAQ